MCRTFLLLSAIILLFAASCGEKELPLQLTGINSIADSISGAGTNTDRALFQKADSLLSSVDVSRLSENDRMYHSMLRVKLTDKAYLRHPGDTIIRPVVEYAEKHRRCGFLPEALYYGGRVYSDIGDSFTALRYYQDALDNLPDEKRNLNLRCRLLSQTLYLLNSLRLYEEAILYLEECMAINKDLKDSTNLFLDIMNLGAIRLHQGEFDKAESMFKNSLKYSSAVSADDSLTSIAYLAGVKEAKNEIDSALLLIRGIPAQVTDSLTRNMVLAYASDIYRKAGINDTAIIYAREIVKNGNPNNKIIGYQNLLKPENIAFIPTDSLTYYVRKYASEMERNLNANGSKLAIIQQAQYNYSIHDRQRREEEERAGILWKVVWGVSGLVFIAIITILLLLLRRKKNLEKLRNSISQTKELKDKIASMESLLTEEIRSLITSSKNRNYAEIKRQLIKDFKSEHLDFAEKWIAAGKIYRPDETILKSQAYKNVMSRFEKNEVIPPADEIWKKLERVVCKCYPQFKNRIISFAGKNLPERDYQIVLLIKCGFSPTVIAAVLSTTISSISHRRKTIGEKLFDRLVSPAVVDAAIQTLCSEADSFQDLIDGERDKNSGHPQNQLTEA